MEHSFDSLLSECEYVGLEEVDVFYAALPTHALMPVASPAPASSAPLLPLPPAKVSLLPGRPSSFTPRPRPRSRQRSFSPVVERSRFRPRIRSRSLSPVQQHAVSPSVHVLNGPVRRPCLGTPVASVSGPLLSRQKPALRFEPQAKTCDGLSSTVIEVYDALVFGYLRGNKRIDLPQPSDVTRFCEAVYERRTGASFLVPAFGGGGDSGSGDSVAVAADVDRAQAVVEEHVVAVRDIIHGVLQQLGALVRVLRQLQAEGALDIHVPVLACGGGSCARVTVAVLPRLVELLGKVHATAIIADMILTSVCDEEQHDRAARLFYGVERSEFAVV